MSERIRELYSAFIDGELTGNEVDQLLDAMGSAKQPGSLNSSLNTEHYKELIAVSTGYQVGQFALKHQVSNKIINHYQQDLNISESHSLEGSATLLDRISQAVADDQLDEHASTAELAYAGGVNPRQISQSFLDRLVNAFSDQYLKGFASATVAATVAALVLVNVQSVVNNPVESTGSEIPGSIAQSSLNSSAKSFDVTPINNSLSSSGYPTSSTNMEFSPSGGEVSFVNAETTNEVQTDVSSEAQAFLVEQERLRAYMMKHAEYSTMNGGLVPFVRVVNIDELENTSESEINDKTELKQ